VGSGHTERKQVPLHSVCIGVELLTSFESSYALGTCLSINEFAL